MTLAEAIIHVLGQDLVLIHLGYPIVDIQTHAPWHSAAIVRYPSSFVMFSRSRMHDAEAQVFALLKAKMRTRFPDESMNHHRVQTTEKAQRGFVAMKHLVPSPSSRTLQSQVFLLAHSTPRPIFKMLSFAFDSTLPPLGIFGALLLLLLFVATTGPAKAQRQLKSVRLPQRMASTLPFIGDTHALLKHAPVMYDWLTDVVRKMNGAPLELKALGRWPMIVLSTPDAFEDVLKTQFDSFPKGQVICEALKDFMGNGIFSVDHAPWIYQRKVSSGLFTMRALHDQMAATIRVNTSKLHRVLAKFSDCRQPVDLCWLFNRFTVEAFAEMGFGAQLNCLESDQDNEFQTALDGVLRLIRQRFLRPAWVWKLQKLLNTGVEREMKQYRAVVDNTVFEIINQALAKRHQRSPTTTDAAENDPPKRTLLSLFLDSESSETNLDAKFLRDMVVNFLLAGRDTTAQTLSWLFYELDQHPDVIAKIREEIVANAPEFVRPTSGEQEEDPLSVPTVEQTQGLVFLEATLKEVLRLHPPVPIINKTVAKDVVLSDGTFLRANTMVLLFNYGMARLESVWGPNATEFRPERWIEPSTGKLRVVSSYKFAAFNAGPRVCLGMNLALMELKIVVTGLLTHFDIKVVPGQNPTYGIAVTLPIKDGLMASVSHRST